MWSFAKSVTNPMAQRSRPDTWPFRLVAMGRDTWQRRMIHAVACLVSNWPSWIHQHIYDNTNRQISRLMWFTSSYCDHVQHSAEFLSQNLRHIRVDLIWGFSASLQISWTRFLDGWKGIRVDSSIQSFMPCVPLCSRHQDVKVFRVSSYGCPHNTDNDGNETHSEVSL